MRHLFIALAVCTVPLAASATQVKCFQDNSTRENVCYDPKGVTQNGELRAAAMYKGGPNQIEKTTLKMVFHCKNGLMELRDKTGVVFARDQPSKVHIVMLRDAVCAESAKTDKKLN